MKWTARKALPLLGVATAAIFIAYLPTGGQSDPAVKAKADPQPVDSITSRSTVQQTQIEHVELERLSRQSAKEGSGKKVSNAFSPTSWYVAPPRQPEPPPPPPPAPTAPPMPFTYLGRYEDPPKRLVILSIGNRLYTVSEGEVIDGNYRVARIGDKAVDLVYLPLNVNQSISTIGVQDNTQHLTGAEERYRRP